MIMTSPETRRRPVRRGAATAEFALLAPFFLAIVLGMIELARGLSVKETLSDAAQRGCRTGALPGKASSDITAEVNAVLANAGINGATVTILVNGQAVDASTAKRFDQISVKVSVPSSQVSWGTNLFLSGQAIESETVVMMRQG